MSTVSILKWFFILIWVFMTVSLATQVVINNMHTTDGAKFQQLMETQERLELENRILENQIAEQRSLKVVEKKAEQMGFQKVTDKQIQYIK